MELWDANCSEEQWQQLQSYLKEQYEMGKKKDKKKKKKQKTYLLIYSNNDTDIIVERLTEKEINVRIRYLELDDDEFTVIDGKIIGKL